MRASLPHLTGGRRGAGLKFHYMIRGKTSPGAAGRPDTFWSAVAWHRFLFLFGQFEIQSGAKPPHSKACRPPIRTSTNRETRFRRRRWGDACRQRATETRWKM